MPGSRLIEIAKGGNYRVVETNEIIPGHRITPYGIPHSPLELSAIEEINSSSSLDFEQARTKNERQIKSLANNYANEWGSSFHYLEFTHESTPIKDGSRVSSFAKIQLYV